MLGSTHFTRTPPPGLAVADVRAMINLDMVGRLRDNRVTVLGAETAAEWQALLDVGVRARAHRVRAVAATGYGPSDQMPFYAAGVPVLHFFTGAHADYHKPTDTADQINAAGAGADRRRWSRRWRPRSRRAASALTFQRMSRPGHRGRRAQLQRVARHHPRLRRPARAARGRAARRRARRRRRREGRPAPRRHPGPPRGARRSAASRT